MITIVIILIRINDGLIKRPWANLEVGGLGSLSAEGRREEARCFDDDHPGRDDAADDGVGDGGPSEDDIGCGDHQRFVQPRPPHQNRGSQAPGAMQGNHPDKESAPESPSLSSAFPSSV